MANAPLPDIFALADCGGDWATYCDRLYAGFAQDFVRSKPTCGAKRCGLKLHPEYDGKAATFWHLISEGAQETERIPDLRRCERLRWPRVMMEHAGIADDLFCWEQVRRRNPSSTGGGTERRIAIATADFDYVLIVADRGDYVLPWTAFFVEQRHRRGRLRAEWHENPVGMPWGG